MELPNMKTKKQLSMEDKINKIKKIDLEMTPTKFHILFDMDNDWNEGNESTMTSLERGRMVQLWLEYNSWEIQRRLKLGVVKEEIEVLQGGFSKDYEDDNKIQGYIH